MTYAATHPPAAVRQRLSGDGSGGDSGREAAEGREAGVPDSRVHAQTRTHIHTGNLAHTCKGQLYKAQGLMDSSEGKCSHWPVSAVTALCIVRELSCLLGRKLFPQFRRRVDKAPWLWLFI